MRPVTSLPRRKHLKYQVWLDMPVGLTPPGATPGGPGPGIVFTREPDKPEPRPGDAQPGRLVIVGIRNHGPAPVSSADLTALLGFTFPGRQVLATWLSDPPAAEKERRPASRPAAGLPDEGGATPHPASGFLLRSRGACTIAVILSGTPAAGSRPARPDGTLASGRITSRSCQ